MMGNLRWGSALFLALGLWGINCSSQHDGPGVAAGNASGSSGHTGSAAGDGAFSGASTAQAGSEPGGAAGTPETDNGGDAGSLEHAGTGGAGAGRGGANNAGGGTAGAAVGDAGSAGTAGGACQNLKLSLSTTTPTVFVLVDRSSSMFLCLTSTNDPPTGLNCSNPSDTPWAALKQGMLQVVQELQGSVRFAFGTFTGEQGKTCPAFSSVGPALNNYNAVQAAYDAATPPQFKAETPTAQALGLVQNLLAADTSPGAKYVLLVTDGEPDFCDDGPAACPVDATVSKLQSMSAAGIGTLVLGVDSPLTSISGASLQAFANAGAGLPVTDPSGLGTDVYYSCYGTPGWNTLFTATGKASPGAIATYGTAASNATVYRPNPSDSAALKQAIAGPIASVKSCTFDVIAGLSVDIDALAGARLTIQGQAVVQSTTNGWSMVNPKRLQLNGSACSSWRSQANQSIAFDVPCGSVKSE